MNENKINIEELILYILKELLVEWESQFYAIDFYADFPFISRYNIDSDNYFSEIEINYYHKNGDFGTFTSIILFKQNQQVLQINDARNFIIERIQECYEELSGQRQA